MCQTVAEHTDTLSKIQKLKSTKEQSAEALVQKNQTFIYSPKIYHRNKLFYSFPEALQPPSSSSQIEDPEKKYERDISLAVGKTFLLTMNMMHSP